MANIKNSGDSRCWRECGKRGNIPPLLVGLQAGTTTLEVSLAVPQDDPYFHPFASKCHDVLVFNLCFLVYC
jgi:hypothetical protein